MDKTKRALLHVELPNDLIVFILMRLPVKSLLRFKCVSKFFFSIISDNQFAMQHFDLAASPTHHLFYLAYTDYAYLSRSVDLSASSLRYSHNDSAALIPPFLPRLCNPQIVGSCNGFILMCDRYHHHLYIWNPSTGAHKKIPMPPIASSDSKRHSLKSYGFGYDASTDDYLVFVASFDLTIEGIRKIECELFSLKANAWNTIDEGNHLPSLTFLRRKGIFLNGVLHWLAHRIHIGKKTIVILAFDLREKSFSEMPFPPMVDFYKHNKYIYYDICVFDGYMCLTTYDSVDDSTEIWVMKEYNLSSSWKKSAELCMLSEAINIEKNKVWWNPIECLPYHHISLRYSTKCSDIVGVNGATRVVKFNAEGQLLEHHSYLDDHDHPPLIYKCDSIMYTESLLSFPS